MTVRVRQAVYKQQVRRLAERFLLPTGETVPRTDAEPSRAAFHAAVRQPGRHGLRRALIVSHLIPRVALPLPAAGRPTDAALRETRERAQVALHAISDIKRLLSDGEGHRKPLPIGDAATIIEHAIPALTLCAIRMEERHAQAMDAGQPASAIDCAISLSLVKNLRKLLSLHTDGGKRSVLSLLVGEHSSRAQLLVEAIGSFHLLRTVGALASCDASGMRSWLEQRDGLQINLGQLRAEIAREWPRLDPLRHLDPCPPPVRHEKLPHDPSGLHKELMWELPLLLDVWTGVQSAPSLVHGVGAGLHTFSQRLAVQLAIGKGCLAPMHKEWSEKVEPRCNHILERVRRTLHAWQA